MTPNKFEEKAHEIIDWHVYYVGENLVLFQDAIATALEAAYQEGRESEAAMNELVKIGQEIEKEVSPALIDGLRRSLEITSKALIEQERENHRLREETARLKRSVLVEAAVDQSAEIIRLRSQRDKLREALEPFAEEADNPEWSDMADHNQAISFCRFSVGDLRAARSAYEETGE